MAFFKKELIDNCRRLGDVGTESNNYIVLIVSYLNEKERNKALKYGFNPKYVNYAITALVVHYDGKFSRLIDMEINYFEGGDMTKYIKEEIKNLSERFYIKKVICLGIGIMAIDTLQNENFDIFEIRSTPNTKTEAFLKLASDINKAKLLIMPSKLNYKLDDLASELESVDIDMQENGTLKIIDAGVRFNTLLTFYEYLIQTNHRKEQEHKNEQDKTNNEYKAKVTLEFDVLHDDEIQIERTLLDAIPIRGGINNKILDYVKSYGYSIVLPHNLRVNGKIEYFKNNKSVALKEINHYLLKTDIKESLKEMNTEEVINALKEAGYEVIIAEKGHFIIKEN